MYATADTAVSSHQLRGGTQAHRTAGRLTRAEMLIATCAVIATLCVALLPVITSGAPVVPQTTAVRVAPNDTLWDLAKAHPLEGSTTAETVSVIRQLNGLEGSMIAAGEVLKVPADASEMTALARR